MSVIGNIGQFLIDNEDIIGTIVVVAFVALLLWLLVRFIVKNRRGNAIEEQEKNALREEINKLSQNQAELVQEIKRIKLGEGKAEPAVESAEVQPAAVKPAAAELASAKPASTKPTVDENAAAVESASEAQHQHEYVSLPQEPKTVEPVLAYLSRDAAVDKYGNVYTEEMLKELIS